MNQNTLSHLVLEAIENPQKRNDFVAKFAETIEAPSAAIVVEDAQLRWATFHATHGIDRATADKYCNHYLDLDPYVLRRPTTPGEVCKSEEVLSEAELRETEFYRGWYEPCGWGHSSAVILDTTETERAFLVAFRPPGHPFTEKETAILNEYAPSLALAAQIAKTKAELESEINRLRNVALEMDMFAGLRLSRAQSHIALAVYKGQSAKEIAQTLGKAPNTIEWHTDRIYKKLGVRGRLEFMRLIRERHNR